MQFVSLLSVLFGSKAKTFLLLKKIIKTKKYINDMIKNLDDFTLLINLAFAVCR